MTLHLTDNGWIQRFLISQPESGMGFQRVELHLKNGGIIPELIATNAKSIEIPSCYRNIAEDDILRIAVLHGGIGQKPAP
jgi:hypothetical protein